MEPTDDTPASEIASSGSSPISQPEEHIRRFAFFPMSGTRVDASPQELGAMAWQRTLDSLASLAEEEDWTGQNLAHSRPLPILDSYLRYTYVRLVQEEKIMASADGHWAAFNTGLLSRHMEEIFGLFSRNWKGDAQDWVHSRWATESDRQILLAFPQSPAMAEYVNAAADLVFDWRLEIKLAYEHILDDNLERFPPNMRVNPRLARQSLDLAVGQAVKRTRRNYKLVVPQWYPRLGAEGGQFLMPLDLTGDDRADLALVLSSVGDSSYRGHTVLTLDMAYTNARLVARPDSDWLKPQAAAMPSADQAFDDEGIDAR